MIFPKRVDFLPQKTAQTFPSGSFTFEITREFHIERIDLRFNVTPTANVATLGADGLFAIVKRIQVTIADGARTRNCVDASAAGLIEYALNIQGALDRNTFDCIKATNAALSSSAVAYQFTVPIWFSHPQIDDPNGSTLLLPAPRFNSNIIVTVTLGAQADVDVNATPTFTATNGVSCMCIVHRRQVSILNWPAFDTEIAESSTAYANSVSPGEIELPVPGNYTGIMARLFQSNAVRGDVGTTPDYYISQLGTNLRRIRFLDAEAENDFSKCQNQATAAVRLAGVLYYDFLTDKSGLSVGDLGSVLDANALSQTGARPKFGISSITGGTSVKVNIVTHRIFGVLDALKLGK